MPAKKKILVPVKLDLPAGYRAMLMVLKANQEYRSLGEMVKAWIDRDIAEGKAVIRHTRDSQ